LAEKEAEEI
jgi:hypothetical protein